VSLLKQLFTSNQTDKLSTTKFWYNVCCVVCTWIVCWYAYHFKLDWEMFIGYLGAVGGFASYSKFIMNKRDRIDK